MSVSERVAILFLIPLASACSVLPACVSGLLSLWQHFSASASWGIGFLPVPTWSRVAGLLQPSLLLHLCKGFFTLWYRPPGSPSVFGPLRSAVLTFERAASTPSPGNSCPLTGERPICLTEALHPSRIKKTRLLKGQCVNKCMDELYPCLLSALFFHHANA